MTSIEVIKEYIKNIFSQTDKAHDYLHSFRVCQNAINIMNHYPEANEEVVILASLLHDTVDEKLFEGSSQLDKWFELYPSPHEKDIRRVVSEISFSKGKKASTIEAEIVQDADRLDAIGAIGIARVFTYGGSIGRPIYANDQPSSLSHFDEKLFKLKNLMNTEIGKTIATERNNYMRNFVEILTEEIKGEI